MIRLFYTLLVAASLGCILACLGCPKNNPTPVPGPGPALGDASSDVVPDATVDPFTGKIFDCHTVTVVNRTAALTPVGVCLGPTTTCVECCLYNIVATKGIDATTVACVARDQGDTANAAVLSGDQTQASIANNARTFIVVEQLGYK